MSPRLLVHGSSCELRLCCRGEATAEDLKGPARAPGSKMERGDWMTQLPPERRPNATPSQKAQVWGLLCDARCLLPLHS